MNELIAHGHRDPGKYTPGQIFLFAQSIARRETRAFCDQAIAMRLAMTPDGKKFDGQIKKLRKQTSK